MLCLLHLPHTCTVLYCLGKVVWLKPFTKVIWPIERGGVLAIESNDTDEHAHIRSGMRAFICLESLKLRATGAVLLLQRWLQQIRNYLGTICMSWGSSLPYKFEDVKDSLKIPQQLILVACCSHRYSRTSPMVTFEPQPTIPRSAAKSSHCFWSSIIIATNVEAEFNAPIGITFHLFFPSGVNKSNFSLASFLLHINTTCQYPESTVNWSR